MKNKRILFFAPSFFGYEIAIKKALEQLGAIVDFYDDRPSNKTLSKIMIRINPKLARFKVREYFKTIIEDNKETNYDFVFFISCEAALEKDLQELRSTFKNAKFILYMYDSIANLKFYDMKKKYFDHIYSFDAEDVCNHDEMRFEPLFYIDDYKQDVNVKKSKYLLSFIGSVHSDRAKIINKIRKELELYKHSYYIRIYVPSKLIFYFRKFTSRDFRELAHNGNITLEKIPANEVSEVMQSSESVIDIQHPRQSGLTMRTIELLGMQKKIVTTNNHIKEYDFYDENNIFIIDRENPTFNFELLRAEYKEVSKEIYESYSIHSWILRVFEFK